MAVDSKEKRSHGVCREEDTWVREETEGRRGSEQRKGLRRGNER